MKQVGGRWMDCVHQLLLLLAWLGGRLPRTGVAAGPAASQGPRRGVWVILLSLFTHASWRRRPERKRVKSRGG